MIQERICQNCGKVFKRNLYPSVIKRGRGKYCSVSCSLMANRSKAFAGRDRFWSDLRYKEIMAKKNRLERNPRYKNGIVSVIHKGGTIRKKLDSIGKCELCGKRGEIGYGGLLVHHVDEDRTNNNLNNLAVLCESCHARAHRGEVVCTCREN